MESKPITIAQQLEILRDILSIRKLLKVGGSYTVVLPKEWVECFCLHTGNDYWVSIRLEGNNIILTPLKEEDLEGLRIETKKGEH